jgi:hypothetical protein
MDTKIPKLYAYIYRNLRLMNPEQTIVSEDMVMDAIRTVCYRTSKNLRLSIIKEMCDDYKLLRRITESRFYVNNDTELRKQLGILKEHIFPIDI